MPFSSTLSLFPGLPGERCRSQALFPPIFHCGVSKKNMCVRLGPTKSNKKKEGQGRARAEPFHPHAGAELSGGEGGGSSSGASSSSSSSTASHRSDVGGGAAAGAALPYAMPPLRLPMNHDGVRFAAYRSFTHESVKCACYHRHPGSCGKIRGRGGAQTVRYGEWEPIAYLLAWSRAGDRAVDKSSHINEVTPSGAGLGAAMRELAEAYGDR